MLRIICPRPIHCRGDDDLADAFWIRRLAVVLVTLRRGEGRIGWRGHWPIG